MPRPASLLLAFVLLSLLAPGAIAKDVRGTRQADRLIGTARKDELRGYAGNDRIYGRAGGDSLFGGRGSDKLEGGPGVDVLAGQHGFDVVSGGRGNDFLYTANPTGTRGWGGDVLYAGAGSDTIRTDQNGERDTISCGRGRDTVYAEKRDAVSQDCEEVFRTG